MAREITIPEKVWVGTAEFSLYLVPPSHEKLDKGECDGSTERNPASIYVSETLTLTELLETIYHELTHAVDFMADVEDGTSEEDIADKHGKFWSQFWINNPKFQRWWTQACVEVRKARQAGGKPKCRGKAG